MGSRITASPSALGVLLAALLMAAGLPAPAAVAQSGNGLYEPFPEAAVKKRAQRYVEGLRARTPEPGRRYSDAELAAGAFVLAGPAGPDLALSGGKSGPPGAGPATARAGGEARSTSGGSGGRDLALPWQLLLIALALCAPVIALAHRGGTRAA